MTPERIEAALAYISPDDRETWVNMGMALHSELNESGFEMWDRWSQQSDSYKSRDALATWRSFKAGGGITIASLYKAARDAGWRDDAPYVPPSPAVIADRQRKAAERAELEQRANQQERQATADRAKAIRAEAAPAKADHPYLVRKQVAPTATLQEITASKAAEILGYCPKSGLNPLTGRLLVVPVKQGDAVSTLELIDGDGRKTALAGSGTKTGGYWATQRLPEGDGAGFTLLIGEGVATVLTASKVTGHTAVAALSSGNLQKVAAIMRERYPAAQLVILADLVKATGQADRHAIEAARSVNGQIAIPDFGANRDRDLTDFNDLAVTCGQEAAKRDIEAASAPASLWPEPQPLTASYAAEPYPLDALPPKVRAAVDEVLGFVQAPPAMVASCALGALSLAIQAYVDVKRAEGLTGPSSLFFLTLGESGERKSSCDGYFTKAIRDYEAEQAKAAEPEIKRYQADLQAWEAKKSGIKEAIRKSSSKGDPTEGDCQRLAELEQAKPEPPRVPRLTYGDATPEALTYSLAKRWPSAGIVTSEAATVFGSHGMGKDSVMRNLGAMNTLWDGAPLHFDRRTTESYTARGARLTVALQVQPATLMEFCAKEGDLARGSGFWARFLMAWPESTQGTRFFKEAPANWPALAVFNQRLKAILSQPAPIDDDGALDPVMLSLSPQAKRAWVDYSNDIERQLGNGGEFSDVKDVASKIADNVARLAALLQVFEHGVGAISADCLNSAKQIVTWHLLEARRFFNEIALAPELADAVKLDRWLIKHCKQEQTDIVNRRWLQQYGPVRNKDRLGAAITELAELDRLQVRKNGKTDLVINPALLGRKPKDATATAATVATDEGATGGTVAKVASVAVANPLYPEEEAAIRAYLASIGETDPAEVEKVLAQCAADPSARDGYLRNAQQIHRQPAKADPAF